MVITDGQENSSKAYKRADVASRVNKQRDAFKWQFVYLGANQDAFHEAATYGIPQQWTMAYNASQEGVRGMNQALTLNTVAYTASLGAARSKAVKGFDDEQRKDAEAK